MSKWIDGRQNDSNSFFFIFVVVVLFSFWISKNKQEEKKIGVKTIILIWLWNTSLYSHSPCGIQNFFFFCWNVKKNLYVKMTNKRGRTNEYIYLVFHWLCVYLRVSLLSLSLSRSLCARIFSFHAYMCACDFVLVGLQLRHRIIYICVFIIECTDFDVCLCVFGVSIFEFMAKIFGRVSVSYSPSVSVPVVLVHRLSLFLPTGLIWNTTLFIRLFLKWIVLRFKLYTDHTVEYNWLQRNKRFRFH